MHKILMNTSKKNYFICDLKTKKKKLDSNDRNTLIKNISLDILKAIQVSSS